MRCPHLSLNIRPDVQNWNVRCPTQLILKPLISSVVSLAQLVSSSVALLAELVLQLELAKEPYTIAGIFIIKLLLISGHPSSSPIAT